MSKIKIKNFGPIKEGYTADDGFMDIKKVTVFIGYQGSGKSTVAKLISTFKWMEKAYFRANYQDREEADKSFENDRLSYHRIHNYFNINDGKKISGLWYEGEAYNMSYENMSFNAGMKQSQEQYKLPKIMYVPSERNFTSVTETNESMKYLPLSVSEFMDEEEIALEALPTGFTDLPINNIVVEYNKNIGAIYLIGKDGYRGRLSEAASGFQSAVPLFVVSQYLANYVKNGAKSLGESGFSGFSGDTRSIFSKEVKKIFEDTTLTDEQKRIAVSEFTKNRINPSAFINIVEEPEQNLFPAAQKKILNSLLEFNNMNPGNELIITTHSPYIINYLTLAIQAHEVAQKAKSYTGLENKIHEIVPKDSMINPEQIVIYEIASDGKIKKLENYKGIPSSENYLNDNIEETNEDFTKLLKIEKQCL